MNETSPNLQKIKNNLSKLKLLILALKDAKNRQEQIEILNQTDEVKGFLEKSPALKTYIAKLDEQAAFILLSLLALGQGDVVFHGMEKHSDPEAALKKILEELEPVEKFYDSIGGIVGYHVAMLKLILEKETGEPHETSLEDRERYLRPSGYDITKETPFIDKVIRKAFEQMHLFAEIYPVGGAGDRLNLKDEKTGEALPSAELLFEGRTLLEGLARDLQAREYLYYKLFGKPVQVPIAMMTSDEKNNHEHILDICHRHQWFGRPKDSYIFFKQPLVPVLTEHGEWAVSEPMKLHFKPGGHGVLWKLALDCGVVDQLFKKGCAFALIRQINNPIAGVDFGLLAFCGCGIENNQKLGFASCSRLLNTAEGMNVLMEKQMDSDYEYCISNIEYPDFVKKHIRDVSEKPGSPFSAFPANTNILFIDLKTIIEAVDKYPVPGMLINMKTKLATRSSEGTFRETLIGRLECLMQNIADVITNRFPHQQQHFKPESLHTFLTYNERRKTISVTKKLYVEGQPIVETPEGCFYDQLYNHHDLFTHYCQMKLPALVPEDEYVKKGPSFLTAYHPALGPTYSVIAQKIQEGSLATGSEMVLEIAELELQQVEVNGSLLIYAENILGHRDEQGQIIYSENVGRCTMRNVKVNNKGIDREKSVPYWKGERVRKESLTILLKGHSEFIAEDIIFLGDMYIEVPEGCRITAHQYEGKIDFILERLPSSIEYWKYKFDENDRIKLKKVTSTL